MITTLKSRRDFLRARNGKHHKNALFVLQCVSGEPGQSAARVGYTVTTRVGNAVERNRIKRRLRASVRKIFPRQAKPGHDYVLIARRGLLTASFDEIGNELHLALDRVHENRSKTRNAAAGRNQPEKRN